VFLKYLKPIFEPFQRARAKGVKARNVKGNIQVDVNRAKAYKNVAGQHVGQAQQLGGQAQQAGGQVPQAGGQAPQAGGQAQEAGAMNTSPIVKKGVLFWKKHLCASCGQELDKSWDACPYCAQAASAPAPAANKTRAIMLDAAGAGSGMQLLGWIVPLKGPQRGELYTLAPMSLVGTDPSCTVCLLDQYMSSQHAEIKAEGGVWILRDLGSTNGTFVNDKRIDQHELVDNDFVRFGQSLVKFKSL
jgi:hypothetical protein